MDNLSKESREKIESVFERYVVSKLTNELQPLKNELSPADEDNDEARIRVKLDAMLDLLDRVDDSSSYIKKEIKGENYKGNTLYKNTTEIKDTTDAICENLNDAFDVLEELKSTTDEKVVIGIEETNKAILSNCERIDQIQTEYRGLFEDVSKNFNFLIEKVETISSEIRVKDAINKKLAFATIGVSGAALLGVIINIVIALL